MSFKPAGRFSCVHPPVQFGFAMLHDHPHGLKNGGHRPDRRFIAPVRPAGFLV
jgi:hypothetical protein